MAAPTDLPPPESRFRLPSSLLRAPGEIWAARLLVKTLAEREIRVQYKQAALGIAWAVVTPVVLMVVLTVFVQRVVTVDTQGVPYTLFSYVGLVAWNFFNGTLSTGGLALINQITLLNKIKCPREVFPLSSMVVVGFNSAIAAAVLLILFAVNRFAPKPTSVLAILPLLVQVTFMVGLTLLVSAIVVYLRDLRHALPVLLNVAFFATPVAYGMEAIPAAWQPVYSLVNPMAPVIDSYRQTILFGNAPNWTLLGLGALTAVVTLVVGFKVFRRLELGFADMA